MPDMISLIKYLDMNELEINIKEGKPYVIVLVDDLCPACQKYKPIVEFFSEKFADKIPVYLLRLENLSALSKITNFSYIEGVPHSFFILGRTILSEVAGVLRFNDFNCAINNLLNATVHQIVR